MQNITASEAVRRAEMITGHFARRFLHWFGSALPDTYLSFDLETTGFEKDWDIPLQIGHTLVVDGKISARREYILQWTRSPYVKQEWLKDKLLYLKDRIEFDPKLGRRTGRTWQFDYERIDREGRDPIKVLTYYRDLFRKCRANDCLFVGQQGWYDSGMFANVSHEFLNGDGFEFDDDEMFDVGSLVKSIQCEPPLMPKPEETLRQWAGRINATRKPGVMWTIKHAVELFGLKADATFDATKLHGAGEDSYWVHRIMQELRKHMHRALESSDDAPLERQPGADRRRKRLRKT